MDNAERINSRAAMIGFFALLLVEVRGRGGILRPLHLLMPAGVLLLMLLN